MPKDIKTASAKPGSLHPAGSASADKQATEHCVLCRGDGWRWILTRGMKFTKVICCDCDGKGRRPVMPNDVLGDQVAKTKGANEVD